MLQSKITADRRKLAPWKFRALLLLLLAPGYIVQLRAQADGSTGSSAPAKQGRTIIASTSADPLAQEQTPANPPIPSQPPRNPTDTTVPVPSTPNPQAPVPQIPEGGSTSPTLGKGDIQFVELRSFTNDTRITGAARDRSFLTGGWNNGVDLSYLQDWTLGAHRYELVSVGRYTDDARVDPEHDSLQRAYFRITGPRSEFNFGDYLVSYTRFTYNQNLKGFHFILGQPSNSGSGFRLMGNAGTFTDRYGSLWKEDILGKPFTRIVSGLRAEERFTRDKSIAFNWAYGNDIVRSIPIDPTLGREPFIPVKNNVVSIDSRLSFGRFWDMQGEVAYSITNPDTRFLGQIPPYGTQVLSNRKDYALRFDNSFRKGAWNFTEYFTRIMPSFYAENARQVADLQDAMARLSWQASNHVSLQATYRRTNDDLREENPLPRTVFQLPEARVSFRDLPGLGNVLLDVGYRERHQQQLGLASRVTRAPFIDVGIPISSSVLSFEFEHRANVDNIDATTQTSANDASVSFRSIFNLGAWQISPLLRYELNREIFDRVNTGNDNRSMQFALILDAPKYFVLEGMYRSIGATLFQDIQQIDPTTFQPVLGPNGLPLYSLAGPSGFRRPSLHAAITYKLRNDENHTIALSYDNNKNWFALPNQNFFERVIQLTVTWRFRKR